MSQLGHKTTAYSMLISSNGNEPLRSCHSALIQAHGKITHLAGCKNVFNGKYIASWKQHGNNQEIDEEGRVLQKEGLTVNCNSAVHVHMNKSLAIKVDLAALWEHCRRNAL